MQRLQIHLLAIFMFAGICIDAAAVDEVNVRQLTSEERTRLVQLKRETGELANKAKKLAREIDKKLKKSNSRRKKFGLEKVKLEIPKFKFPASVFQFDKHWDREIRETTAKLEWATEHIKVLEKLLDEAEDAGEIDTSKIELTPKTLKALLKESGKGLRLRDLVKEFRALPEDALTKEDSPAAKDRSKLIEKYQGKHFLGECVIQEINETAISASLYRKTAGEAPVPGQDCTIKLNTFAKTAKNLGKGDTIRFDGFLESLEHSKEGLALTMKQMSQVIRTRKAKLTDLEPKPAP